MLPCSRSVVESVVDEVERGWGRSVVVPAKRKGFKHGKSSSKYRDGNPGNPEARDFARRIRRILFDCNPPISSRNGQRSESESESETESVLGVRGCKGTAGLELWAVMAAGGILYLLTGAKWMSLMFCC